MSIAKIMLLVEKLSAAEKLQLNEQLAASMVGQTSSAAAKSTRKGKPAAAGTLAWSAFIAHAKETMPERFAPPALPKDRMAIAKAIKEENPDAYTAFCKKFLAERDAAAAAASAPSSDVEADAPAPAPPAPASPAPAPAPAPASPAPAPAAAPAAADPKAAANAKAIAAKAARAKKVAA
uniref:Uncharacterized protein n=1 Tax=viral metagenome TaxID=1070528 RepID=A0A6C0L6L8_9ZZZZ